MFPLFLDIWDFHLRGQNREFFLFFYLSLLFVGVKEDEEQTQYCHRLHTSTLPLLLGLMEINLQTNRNESHVQYVT